MLAGGTTAVGYRVAEFLTKPANESDLLDALKRIGVGSRNLRKILCIDDDPRSLKLAEIALLGAGYIPVCQSDGRAALQFLEKERPAAIVLDLLMPGMDGFEFMEEFRRRADYGLIPVILWTVKDLTLEDRSRLQASVQAIVMKGRSGTAQLFEELERYIAPPHRLNEPPHDAKNQTG
jgi:CheY-like chemotaxis protein